jgi:hypothetical protein
MQTPSSIIDALERAPEIVVPLGREVPHEWDRTAEHGEYSHYSDVIMFRHLALHDFFHAYRIEELLLKREWNTEWQTFATRQSPHLSSNF